MTLVLLAYAAVATAFYVACVVEIRRTRPPGLLPPDPADEFILHLVGILASLLWPAALPALLRAWLERVRPRQVVSRAREGGAAGLAGRTTRLAG